ncbi:hypothetical protein L21SP3_01185 [Sedimentisphaera cyanobacteriorum]|uniref:Uncharacterized protein n=1 Tax=Sedimentisphaera cyanobacteriorum TaxID=1940790 RepID=A0A1Q2HPX8_9BACT|nr:type II secretion system protein [Sedimentisphaera cyanobacteriorum]AQQ09381.1 hypothetical protein L21SP3_01185 [Sedimentisphaera cyanobacteriorum]
MKTLSQNTKAFTLLESMAALFVMGIVTTGVMVTISNCINSMTDMRLEQEAVKLARENMEYLLAESNVREYVESGVDEYNTNLSWEMGYEVKTFPDTDQQWVMAFSVVEYYNSENELESVELENWLAKLSMRESQQLEEQRQLEQEYLDQLSEEDAEYEAQQDESSEQSKADEQGKQDNDEDSSGSQQDSASGRGQSQSNFEDLKDEVNDMFGGQE